MLHKFYTLFTALIVVFCCAVNVKTDGYTLIPSTRQKVYVLITAKSAKGKLLITSYGRAAIRDFDYIFSFNGKELMSKNYVLTNPLNRMEGTTIEIDIPPHAQVSETDFLFTITKVNGELNSATFNYATLPKVTVIGVPHRKVVVEEYTGVWCGFCSCSIALMENLARKYGEDLIGTAIHTGGRADPLACTDYAWKATDHRSRPSLDMNRSPLPGYFKAQTEFEEERSKGADMDITVSAVWDKEKNNITVTLCVTFCVNRDETPYGFTYVLTEDDTSNPNWAQYNNYSGSTDDHGITKEFGYSIDAPRDIRNLENSSVAITAEGVKAPLTGYIKTPIKVDEPQSHTYIFENISNKRTIQDKSGLKVYVLPINKTTGCIENAAKCMISEPNTAAISSLSQGEGQVVETARYTPDGHRITTPQKGINIAKYNDSRVSKEAVTQ